MRDCEDSMDHSAQDNIEPAAKRQCLSLTPDAEGETYEETPEELPEDFDLPAARAHNDSKLKSLFEGIFAKYSHDFTDVGDEIDLETGKLVVDNGHLLGLQGEGGNGDQPRSWLFQADQDDAENHATDLVEDTEDPKNHQLGSPASSLSGYLPDATAIDGPVGAPPSDRLRANEDDSLDFVFTFKASGATGMSPVTKTQHSSHPTNPINPHSPIPASNPQDPIWAVPDLPQAFSTPTAATRKINVGPSSVARSPSPPGSGSLWAVKGPGRPRTESKPKATPTRRKQATKRKYQSSPITRDWSFAEMPDGNESDDPLQDYEPSQTPSKTRIIRGKRQVPTKDGEDPRSQSLNTPSKTRVKQVNIQIPTLDSDGLSAQSRLSLEVPTLPVTQIDQDNGSEETVMNTRADHVPDAEMPNLESPHSDLEVHDENREKEGEVNRQENKPWQMESHNEGNVDCTDISIAEHHSAEEAGSTDAREKAPDAPQSTLGFESTSQPKSTSTPRAKVASSHAPLNTPSKRRIVKPDEAKFIMRVMHNEKGKASDVVKMMPDLGYQTVWHWFFNHWTHRLASSPQLSAPWSHSELATFTRLSNQSGLSWADIQREFSGRSRSEVELELLRAFVTERVTSAAESPAEQLDDQADSQLQDSSQEIYVQADEFKAGSESEGAVHSVQQGDREVRGESVSSTTTDAGHAGLEVERNGYTNSSYVANTLRGMFIK